MYERFYQLRERPFALSPDPDYLYPSRVHREALDYLRFGIEGNAGFVVITGEIGSGKTTLLQVLLRSLDGQTTVVRLVNTLLTGRELLESLLLDFGVADPPPTKPLMLRELARLLVEQRAAGRRVVAVIDEAQNLPLDALEELRMLSNMETEKSKLIQIVLVGQPDLRDTLEQPSVEQLRQRVTVRYHLDRLDQHETEQYINHRLKRAATAAPLTFPRDVTNAIHARSGGVPRMINVICDGVLLCGYAEESRVVDQQLVRMAIEELELSSVLRPTTNVGTRAQAASSGAVAASVPARPPAVAAPAVPASSPAVPWTRATLAEMQLRPVAHGPSTFTDRPLRQPEPVRSPVAPAMATVRQPVARTAYAPAGAALAAAQGRPVASGPRFSAEPARSGGAWTWLKDVLFGSGPEAERR
jgi:putative secretion ATPase (PEP-CTERM system associated)